MPDIRTFFATCPKTIEGLLRKELLDLGAEDVKETRAGVHFKGSLKTAYRICLWSRLANRVLLHLGTLRAADPDDLYEQVYHRLDWNDHLEADGSLAVDFVSVGSNQFHSHYAALRVKDAVVDQFSHRFGYRPNVDTRQPDIRINVLMKKDQARVSLDLAGESLHRRGYRTQAGEAPLKENLAAALLLRAGWPQLAHEHRSILDPMCGSGTLLMEAALMALDRAPGLTRSYFGFLGWKQHDPKRFTALMEEATRRAEAGVQKNQSLFYGFDWDQRVLDRAAANAVRADLSSFMHFECRDLKHLSPPDLPRPGFLMVNPPYGKRMGGKRALQDLYHAFGDRLKSHFQGWRVSVLTANPDLAKHMGVRAGKIYHFYNGSLPCKLLNFEIYESPDAPGNPPGPTQPQKGQNDPSTQKRRGNRPTKIVSGGQTGADRAALDVAIRFNIPHGGWVPKGRRAEDGRISDRYQVREMPTGRYRRRTEQNIIDSDGTLIFSFGTPKGGSELTLELAKKHRRPHLHLDLESVSPGDAARRVIAFIERHNIAVLNVAGPRASEAPRIYSAVSHVLDKVLRKGEKIMPPNKTRTKASNPSRRQESGL